ASTSTPITSTLRSPRASPTVPDSGSSSRRLRCGRPASKSPSRWRSMSRHVACLSRLFVAWSAFNGIGGGSILAFAVSAASLAATSGADREGTEVAAGVTAAMLGLVAIAALTWGGVHYYCARGLRAHRPGARALGLALAMFNLPLLPLGTGLGSYALWVLLSNDTRNLFGTDAA